MLKFMITSTNVKKPPEGVDWGLVLLSGSFLTIQGFKGIAVLTRHFAPWYTYYAASLSVHRISVFNDKQVKLYQLANSKFQTNTN